MERSSSVQKNLVPLTSERPRNRIKFRKQGADQGIVDEEPLGGRALLLACANGDEADDSGTAVMTVTHTLAQTPK